MRVNNRVLYSLIFAFLTAVTVNAAHEVVEHERSVCEVCLHSYANNDFDDVVPTALVFPTLKHQNDTAVITLLLSDKFLSQDSIRAPPLFV